MEDSSNKTPTLFGAEKTLTPREGRDEMNFAEFPITLLGHRASADIKTLHFSKQITAKNGKPLNQKWTITSTDAYGLPVSGDEELYLVLLEITRQQGFKKRICFTRYELVRLLGWPLKGDSYKRVEEGLLRLKGVSIIAEYAFWDKATREYLKVAAFNIIDEFEIHSESARSANQNQSEFPLSWFQWSDKVLGSFQSGHIKQLDLNRFFRLESSVSRRLFRFLDRKFGHKHDFAIEVMLLAHEHIGMTRSWKYPSDLKRRLTPALEELVSDGYLESYLFRPSTQNRRNEILECRKAAMAKVIAKPGEFPPLLERDPAAYFYEQIYGIVHGQAVSTKDRKAAKDFVAEHGLAEWKEFVAYAVDYRKTHWPDMKSLSGAMTSCLHPFMEKSRSRRSESQAFNEEQIRAQWHDFLSAEMKNFEHAQPMKMQEFREELKSVQSYKAALRQVEAPSVRSPQWDSNARKKLIEVTLEEFARRFVNFKNFEDWKAGVLTAEATTISPPLD